MRSGTGADNKSTTGNRRALMPGSDGRSGYDGKSLVRCSNVSGGLRE